MIDAHIQDADYVAINRRRTAYPGQVLVTQTDTAEATLKFWFSEKSKRRIRL